MAAAVALVHPSPFESFGMVVTEAWALGTPVIAFGGNDVLRGHIERSGGGVTVTTGAELGAAADDRKSVVEGKSVSGCVDLGGSRIIKQKNQRTAPRSTEGQNSKK